METIISKPNLLDADSVNSSLKNVESLAVYACYCVSEKHE